MDWKDAVTNELSKEILISKWYSVHFAESGEWQVRTGSVIEYPLGFIIGSFQFQTIADHIVLAHNDWLANHEGRL